MFVFLFVFGIWIAVFWCFFTSCIGQKLDTFLGVEFLAGIFDHFFCNVSIDIHRYGDIGMTEKILGGFDVDTFFRELCGVGVA